METTLQKQYLQNNDLVLFSLVQKQSQKGFSTNKRLLFMLQNQFICYFSQPKIENTLTYQYIKEHAKIIVPLSQLSKITQKKSQKKIMIHFWIQQNAKKSDKIWTIILATEALWQSWIELFDDYINRSRNFTMKQNQKSFVKEVNKPMSNQSDDFGIHNYKPLNANQRNISQAQRGYQAKGLYTQPELNPKKYQSNMAQNKTKQNKNDKYFSNFNNNGNIQLPSYNQPYRNNNFQQQKITNISNSVMKDRSMYFSNNFYMNAPLNVKHNFQNYYIPYLDGLLSKSYDHNKINNLNTINHKFNSFVQYARNNVANLIDYKAGSINAMLKGNSWFKYDEIQDINIELGFTQMKSVKNQNYVCDDSLSKLAQKNFKNLQFLYSVIKQDKELSETFYIPMMCMVKYKGFKCFVTSKIIPQLDQQQYENNMKSQKNTSLLFEKLSASSKIALQIFQKAIYIKFIPKNKSKDKFVITSAKSYLPQIDNCTAIRPQAFNLFTSVSKESYSIRGSKKQLQMNINKIKGFNEQKIVQLSEKMNKLLVYPVSPSQFSEILHLYGLNVKHLGALYHRTNQYYAQAIIKTQAMLRSFKFIFGKKMQQNVSNSQEASHFQQSAKQLLNMLLGYGQSSDQLWKVVSLHCQLYFSLSIDRSQMNRGYLLLGLIYHLNLQPFYGYSNLQQSIFKVNTLIFSLKFKVKSKCPNILPQIMNIFKEQHDSSALNQSLFNEIIITFELGTNEIPNFLKHYPYIYHQLLNLLSFYIQPNNNRYQHLHLYSSEMKSQYQKIRQLSIAYLHQSIIQVKWMIKNSQNPELVILLLNKIKETVQGYYGKFHPFIEEIYQILSIYYLENFKEEEAIHVNKESLSNMIQCCGNNSKHLKISNNYYQLAQCYKRCYKIQEAISHYKKCKNLLQINSYQNNPEYAHILYKLAIMYLLQAKDQEAYQLLVYSLSIYQNHNLLVNWSIIVQTIEAIYRCNITPGTVKKLPLSLQDSRLAEHCLFVLKQVLLKQLQFEICSQQQFIAIFKIIVEQYLGLLKRQQRTFFRSYIIHLSDSLNTNFQSLNRSQELNYFKTLILQDKFASWIQTYVNKTGQILIRINEEKRIGRLIPNRRNELIESYDSFMANLVLVLGEAFMINIIK